MTDKMEDGGRGTIVLKAKRSKPVVQRHPWVFSGAIERIEGDPTDGDVVEVVDSSRKWLARGYINRRSQIVARLLTWDRSEAIDDSFWERRLAHAVEDRRRLSTDSATTAYRLVHAESDFLPGLIVDRYGDWLVVQCLTLGIERHRDSIVGALRSLLAPRGIVERSDVDVRAKEGLEERTGLLWGDDAPATVTIRENGYQFVVDMAGGHKTGFYLDQRENRARLPAYCPGADVLDVFAYTGAFSVYAAGGGARSVTLIDDSAQALELAQRNLMLNGFGALDAAFVDGNVFSVLRGYRAQERAFDVIVLDPPKFANAPREVNRAARAYKDVNLLAFQLLRPGGTLLTFSCSGAVSAELFQKIVFGAALDARRDAQIIGTMVQGSDHPVSLAFPEGAYLKGLIVRSL